MAYIEKDFPVERLNPVALAEGNSKKPVYQMHKWWARRLGSVFRMILLTALSSEGETSVSIWHKFCEGAELSGQTILDPFMGGGTPIVEALRLGCRVIGVDINPVAWFVTKKEIEPVSLDALDAALQTLEKTAGEEIRRYYRTTCPQGHPAEGMYYFWVKTAKCVRCGATVRLFPNYVLSRRDHLHVSICPTCLRIVETPGYRQHMVCPDCGTTFDPHKGVSERGLFQCPECGYRQRILDAVEHSGQRLEIQLYALEGYCETCGRFFKRVDEQDLALWEQARAEWERREHTLPVPQQPIPTEGRSDPRPVNHGYTHFRHLFNERQLLCLSLLLQRILELPDPNVRELMLLAFSDCLDTNNMFCKYEVDWRKISVFFGLHAYHPIERPTENNVWGTAFGRGTFVKCVEKVRRGKFYCQHPYERLPRPDGGRRRKHTRDRIEGYVVRDFDELMRTERGALLRCQSAEDLSFIPSASVDAVVTDPPYFDNVQYSELADFFYVWLRLGLKDTYPFFQPDFSGSPDEIVENERLGKTSQFFIRRLQRVFTECHRVLKDDGLLVFTFHHNRLDAWEGMARLLLDAGFYISATPVVRSEGRSGFHSSAGNIRYDCILVCRKQPAPPIETDWSSLKEKILADALSWAKRTVQSGMSLNRVDLFTIVMGKTIQYLTSTIAARFNPPDRTSVAGGAALPISLRQALEEMDNLMENISWEMEEGGSGFSPAPPPSAPYTEKLRPLTLFVLESKREHTDNPSHQQPEVTNH